MPFFVKRNGQAVPIVSEPNVINDTTASQNTAFSGSKVDNLIANHTHASNQINAMTGYSKPSSTSNITPADSLNTAIGKVEKGLEGKQSPLSLGQYSGLGREIQVMEFDEVGQTWYNTGVVDIEPSSSEGKLTVSKVDDSVFPGSAPYTSEDIDIPGWEKVENSPITVSATGSDLTLSTSSGNINALTVYGKSEVVDGAIKSAGEGYAVVDLGTLGWSYTTVFIADLPYEPKIRGGSAFVSIYATDAEMSSVEMPDHSLQIIKTSNDNKIWIKDSTYTNTTDFTTAMNGVKLVYELADPTQGNTIAVKTDNGSGIDGTMATFSTGTPLYGVSDTVRDVMQWDGNAGSVTKIYGEIDLGSLTWIKTTDYTNPIFIANVNGKKVNNLNYVCAKYVTSNIITGPTALNAMVNGEIGAGGNNASVYICDTNPAYTNAVTFKTAMSGVKLVYELATPTIERLTTDENASIAGLRTFTPTTHAQNNAQTDMTVEAYAGTENGKAITEIADKLDTLTPKVYSLFIAKTDWEETGTVEIDVPGTFGYDIPSENYNQIVLSDEQTNHWRRFNVSLDSAHDASGKITTIEFSCDYNNIPDRPIYFNIVSSRPKYVDWSVLGNLIVPPGLQVDTSFDSDSTNPVQNKVIKSALDGKATPADIAALINDTTAAQNKTYSSAKVEEKVAGEEITTTATGTDLTLSTSSGNVNALTVYGKSEVVDGAITSAGDSGSITITSYNKTANLITSIIQGTVNEDGSLNLSYSRRVMTTPIYIEPNTKIFLNSNSTALVYEVNEWDENDNYLGYYGINSVSGSRIVGTKTHKIIVTFRYSDNANITPEVVSNATITLSPSDTTTATFSTGTPLFGVSDTVRDVMTWGGTNGTVTKVCAKVRLSDLTWNSMFDTTSGKFFFFTIQPGIINKAIGSAEMICSKYRTVGPDRDALRQYNKAIAPYNTSTSMVAVRDDDYTTLEDFVSSLGDAELVYELATPTTEQLTSTENESLAGLRTFEPQTHAQNNAGATMTVEAYAGTANGKAVQELKQDVQSEITALKITQSNTLTLTTAGWSNNAQTITYAHDTAKRNVIDVDPSSVEEWANCGILATAETATSITFTCKTVPTNALSFRVTSMGV